MLGAPTTDQEFMRFALGQNLRFASGHFRGHDLRMSDWPAPLYILGATDVGGDAKDVVITRLIAAATWELDIYSTGVRFRWPTPAALKSRECQPTIAADFPCMPFSTDMIERMNSEVTSAISKRTKGRNFTHHSRENLLHQQAIVHTQRGGDHPLSTGPSHENKSESICASPLLLPLPFGVARPQALPPLVAPDVVAPPALGDSMPAGNVPLQPGPVVLHGADHTSSSAFGTLAALERPHAQYVGAESGQYDNDQDPPAAAGLSPYMLEKNKFMKP